MRSPSSQLSHPKYRPDIDGLRAIAVLSVVAFHAFPDWISGGFIGVDIFFVISGFLISTIIFDNLQKGTFSFSEFYSRRIRRIFPALFLVLLASYAFGWFALLPDEYKQLGKHIAAGAGFVSNFALWGESGYFDNTAETKPLLHLWSLGIEEQFYLVWPFVMWLAWNCGINLLNLTIFVAVISFSVNFYSVDKDFVATFYSPQTRFWELSSGSVLAWLNLRKTDEPASFHWKMGHVFLREGNQRGRDVRASIVLGAISFIGCLLFAFGFWRISKSTEFPGAWALVPVGGALLIILAGPQAWINRNILSQKILVWFGLISFPLYLWHWPLLSFARIVESNTPSLYIRVAALIVSVMLAWVTYAFIERPIRSGKNQGLKTVVLLLLVVLVGSVGYTTFRQDGFGFRARDREEFISHFENSFPSWSYFKKINLDTEWRSECSFLDEEKYRKEGTLAGGVRNSKPVAELHPSCFKRDLKFDKSVLILGDSHAQALSPGLRKHMPRNWQVLQIASSDCPLDPFAEEPSSESQCAQSNYFAMRTVREVVPDVVVIAQAKDHSINLMRAVSQKLSVLGVRKVLFIGPTPQWTGDLPKIMARQLWLIKPTRTFVGINQSVREANTHYLKECVKQGLVCVDVMGFFCDERGCLTHTSDDVRESLTTWDYGHLTPSASEYLAKFLLVNRIVSRESCSEVGAVQGGECAVR